MYEKYNFFQAGLFHQPNNKDFESDQFIKNGYLKTSLKCVILDVHMCLKTILKKMLFKGIDNDKN